MEIFTVIFDEKLCATVRINVVILTIKCESQLSTNVLFEARLCREPLCLCVFEATNVVTKTLIYC